MKKKTKKNSQIEACEMNYDPIFLDDEYVDIWNIERACWEDGGIVFGSMVSPVDCITHNYFIILYDGIVYQNSALRHNGKVRWVEEKYLRSAHNPKND